LLNDAYFAGCSIVKLRNPVEWIQMPWIRPEDVPVYVGEGILHFKLSDRLASTDTLLMIARSYLSITSPSDLFILIERDGAKFEILGDGNAPKKLVINSNRIPNNFIDHFVDGSCISTDHKCRFCKSVARSAIEKVAGSDHHVSKELRSKIPPELLERADYNC